MLAEAPVHRKRHDWSPKFHVYKFVIEIAWKLAVWISAWNLVPHCPQFLGHHFAHLIDFVHLKIPATVPTPGQVICLSWLFAAVFAAVLELFMLIIAQTGFAFPGLSFFARVSRTMVSSDKEVKLLKRTKDNKVASSLQW